MSNVKNNASAQETRRLLIDAAGYVFAECGLHAAKIKQITERAGVNLAAVNYHFSDKCELYAAVIRHALSLTRIASATSTPPAGDAQHRLRAFIEMLIEDLYDPARPRWLPTLLAHEFAAPTAALTSVIDELIRPRVDYVNRIIRDIVGPDPTDTEVRRAGMSVTSQCFVYLYSGEIIRRVHPDLTGAGQKQAIVEHIFRFSLGGLQAVCDARIRMPGGKPSRRRAAKTP